MLAINLLVISLVDTLLSFIDALFILLTVTALLITYILLLFSNVVFYTHLGDSIFRIYITLTIKLLLLWKV